jgi:hypothetical protein
MSGIRGCDLKASSTYVCRSEKDILVLHSIQREHVHLLAISHIHSHNIDILGFVKTTGENFVPRFFQWIVASGEEGDVCA